MVWKFYLFLLAQGFMPSFDSFQYYFAINTLDISLFLISMSTVILGLMAFIGPIIYQKHMKDTKYKLLFYKIQLVYVF